MRRAMFFVFVMHVALGAGHAEAQGEPDEDTDEEAQLRRMPEMMPDSLSHGLGPRGPEIDLPSWSATPRGALGVELDAALDAGSFAEEGGAWLGGSFGVALQLDMPPAGGVVGGLLGDGVGLGAHVQVLSRVDGEEGAPLVAVGCRLALSHRVASTALRVPSLLGALVPEAGGLFRGDAPAGGYLAWDLPFALLLAPHLALDLRPRVMVALYPEGSLPALDVFIGVSLGLAGVQLGAELPRSSGSLISL